MSIRSLEPKLLWNHFADLNAIPRPSKKEERICQFMIDFGKNLGLETQQDAIGNIIIKKPASKGMEQQKTIILQGHLDMVHQKNSDTVFDFDTQGIEMLVEGDWVRANGTTLGSDNGIGVAAIMAVLSSNEISHPAIEALFTIDEETGMTGAIKLDPSYFDGEILLNLDTEDDDELSIGCAGGIDTNTTFSYSEENPNANSKTIEISILGLLGGHSGMDIDKGRGNANKILARILWEINKAISIQLVAFDGGSLRNAIPREAKVHLVVKDSDCTIFYELLDKQIKIILEEYKAIEPAINIQSSEINAAQKVMNSSDFKKIINLLCSIHNGVYRMSPDIEGLVEVSSSLARVIIQNGTFTSQSLQRSSVESTKAEIAMNIRCAFENSGCEVIQGGDYPGWKPNPNSDILKCMEQLYKNMFRENPKVKACHAGLECGILGKHLPEVDMISFGPNIRAAHSPDEKVQISSVQKFWKFYLEVLRQIPSKN